jgi:hypothetical protein
MKQGKYIIDTSGGLNKVQEQIIRLDEKLLMEKTRRILKSHSPLKFLNSAMNPAFQIPLTYGSGNLTKYLQVPFSKTGMEKLS